ncbi:hypothetical protein YW3DRAFT_07376 [Streptomyces sp. MnatMP-M77]|nr:hypothetical protein YW3DRAFT_07376 [Streptomyces sp. MnatMP-M77]
MRQLVEQVEGRVVGQVVGQAAWSAVCAGTPTATLSGLHRHGYRPPTATRPPPRAVKRCRVAVGMAVQTGHGGGGRAVLRARPVGKPPGRWASPGRRRACPPPPGPSSDPLDVRWRSAGTCPLDRSWTGPSGSLDGIPGPPAARREPGGGLHRRLPAQVAAQVFLAVGRGLYRRCEPLDEPAARSPWSDPAGKPGKHADTSFPSAGKRRADPLHHPGPGPGGRAQGARVSRTQEAQPRPGPGAGVRYPAPDASRPPRAPPPCHPAAGHRQPPAHRQAR